MDFGPCPCIFFLEFLTCCEPVSGFGSARLLGVVEALLDAAIPLYAWADREMHQEAADSARKQLGERA
jgi:hypothetical protein